MTKIHKLGHELLPYPAYSSDLAPYDYFSFPNLKKWLGGKRIWTNEEVITETNAYFEGLETTFYLEGIKKLDKRWTKCIQLNGDYVEKQNAYFPKKKYILFKKSPTSQTILVNDKFKLI